MRTRTTFHPYIGTAMCAALLLSATSSCGDGDSGNGSGNADDPRFAVGLRVTSADLSSVSYFIGFPDDLDSGEIDLSDTFEVSGNASLWGIDGVGEFYIVSAEDLTITKYRMEAGAPVQSGRIGLGNELTFLFTETMLFDGPDRGYLFALISGAALELDLEAMQIVRSLDVDALLDPEQPTFLSYRYVVRETETVFSTYATNFEQETFSQVSQIVFFDPATGEFDARPAPCGGLVYAMEADNGDLFFSTDTFVAGIHELYGDTRAPEPCIVRVPEGSREPEKVIALNEVTGRPTGGFVPAGDSSVYVRVLDTDAVALTEETTAIELYNGLVWETWELDLARPEEATRLDRRLFGGFIAYFEADGDIYENDPAPDFSSSTLIRTTGPDAPARALTAPGAPLYVVKLR